MTEHRILRFAGLGHQLATNLARFSLDLIALVADYVVFPGPPLSNPNLEIKPQKMLELKDLDGIYAVACPSDDRILVASKKKVEMFEGQGKFVQAVCHEKVTGMAIDQKADEIYMCQPNANRVIICDLQGQMKREFYMSPPIRTSAPSNVSVAAHQDRVYLVNNWKKLYILTRKGNWIKLIKGTKNHGKFQNISAVCASDDGFCLAADDKICFYNGKLEYIRCMMVSNKPRHLAFNDFGQLISVGNDARIYDAVSCELLSRFLEPEKPINVETTVHEIRGVCVDVQGRMLMAVKRHHEFVFLSGSCGRVVVASNLVQAFAFTSP